MKCISGVLFAAMVLMGAARTQAQMVTIPDPNFLIFLQNSDVAGCLTGNQLDASCPAVLNKHTLDCSNFNIADLSGMGAFVNLTNLVCNDNNLTILPTLPSQLDTLICYGNQLTTLPTLPNTLAYLECGYNPLASISYLPQSLLVLNCTATNLTALPVLPTGLTQLYCGGDPLWNGTSPLASLPMLPNSLLTLDCACSHVASLPLLPNSLVELSCGGNQVSGWTSPINSLPPLPSTLEWLNCYYTLIASLPPLPASLTHLRCMNNHLTSLPTLPSGLLELNCSSNLLTVLPILPATLYTLECYNNLLPSLPVLSNSLLELYCENNLLTALPALPASLGSLICANNQLTTLPTLPASLTELSCSGNMLTTLPTIPSSLTTIYCASNQLTSLPSLPPVMSILNISNNSGITCLPIIAKITGSSNNSSIGGTSITCLPNIIQHTGSIPSIDTLPVCGIFNPSGCEVAWNIKGTTYRDDNSNCASDSSEPHIQNVKLQLLQNGNVQQQVYSNGVGDFSFDTNLGTYQTRVDTTGLPFDVLCPNVGLHTSTLIAWDSLDYTADFALQCKPGYDLAVQSIYHSAGLFFPAHQATLNIQAGDLAHYYGVACNTVGLGGTVTAAYSGPLHATAASGNGTVSGNTVTWNVNDFSQLSFFNDFSITFLVDTIPATNQMCLTVMVNPSSGTDNNPSNNSLTQCFQVVNSFDPNYKEVYPTHVDSAGQWLTYTVHFQNTGTAPAQNILVIDTLDSNLDLSSFQLLAYSHDNLTQVLNNGIVHFNFPNIELPDSNTNEPLSHGWIQYRVKTNSNVTSSTPIHNTASIYFDFNTPVVTNDAAVNYCTPVSHGETIRLCMGDSVSLNGAWVHNSGTFVSTFPSAAGCDSVVTYQVNAFTADTTVTLSNATMTAPPGMLEYVWYDCDSQHIISTSNQSFTATHNGRYSVMFIYGQGCEWYSPCITVSGLDVAVLLMLHASINPTLNCSGNNFELNTDQPCTLRVYDLDGRQVREFQFGTGNHAFALNGLTEGCYVCRMQTPSALVTKRVVIVRCD